MVGRAGMLAVGLTAMLVISGCGDARESRPVENLKLVSTTPAGLNPVETVNWALPFGEPLSLDPAKAIGESEETVVGNMCESILSLGPDYTVEPGIAITADWVDSTTFVVDLRNDAKFWDGSDLTADDVVYSMQRHTDPRVQSGYGYQFALVQSIERTGPLQVTIRFTEHDAQFRNAMASYGGAVIQRAYADHAGGDLGTPHGGLMCTGPYQFDEWAAGDSITISKNENYSGAIPKVGTLKFQFITDSATLTSALLAGEVDGTFNAPVSSVDAFANASEGELYIGPSTTFYGVMPVSPDGPAADPRMRRAIDLAINKDAYVNGILRGYGEPLKTLTPPMVWEGIPGHEIYQTAYDRLPAQIQDLDGARALVSEADPGSRTLVFAAKAGDSLATQSATIVQAAARDLGFDAQIKALQPTDFDAFFFDENARKGVDFIITPGWIEVPGVFYYAPQYVLPGGFFNMTNYEDPKVTNLMNRARVSSDPNESAQLFGEAQALFSPAYTSIPLAITYSRVFLNNDLSGVTTSSAFLSTPWAANLGGK